MDQREGAAGLDNAAFLAHWNSLTPEQRAQDEPGTWRFRMLVPRARALHEALVQHDDDRERRAVLEEMPADDGWNFNAEPVSEHDTSEKPRRNIINWSELKGKEPPKFDWIWDHWLSWHPTGLWGRGGIGKSLLAQQIETACVLGRPLWGQASPPVKVLAWHCEDDMDELWRRQDRICKATRTDFDMLGNLHIDARRGMENALFTTEYGRPMWTSLYSDLKQEVNDYGAQILVLDNINQIFGGDPNNAHHVTTFVNGIIGLVTDRPFCPLLLGHVAKAQGSEFAGNMAWENAVRMRWYFAEKLPEEADREPTEPGAEGTEDRFLCKRKANYTARDYVRFQYREGVFEPAQDPEAASEGGMIGHLRERRARSIVLQAVQRMAGMGVFGGDQKGANYLPAKIVELKLGEGATKTELRAAMNALMLDGELVKGVVGSYAKGTPKMGLTVPEKRPAFEAPKT